jgi:hypothetical protein
MYVKINMGFLLIDSNIFASLLIFSIVKLEQLELIGALYVPFINSNPDCCCWLAEKLELEVL